MQESATLTVKYAMKVEKQHESADATNCEWENLSTHFEKQNKMSIIYIRNGCDLCLKHFHMRNE